MSSFSLDSQKQDISSKIFNADNFSIFTSIGLHLLLLGGLLPSLTEFYTKPNTDAQQRTVGVFELNTIEQSRLPNLSPTPEVPSVPSVPSLPNLPPLDSAIPNSSLNPGSPPPSIPSLPSLPSLPPLPPLSSLPSAPSSSIGVYSPPIPSIRIPRTQSYLPPAPPSYLPAPPPYLPAPPNNPSNLNPEVLKPRPITKPQFDPFRDTLDLDNLRRAPITASQEEQLRNQQQRETTTETALTPQNPVTPTQPDQTSINAERRRRLLNDVLEGSASLQQDSTNTSDEDARKNYIAWLNRVKEVQPAAIYVTGIYPITACSRKIEGTSVYGLSVNPQGIMTGTPYLIKSAGYPILNQKAFQMVRSMSFQNASGQIKPYRVTVSYKYDPNVCPGYRQPLEQNPVETRVNPPQTPVLESPNAPITPKPENRTNPPATAPQTPANPQPENVRVEPPITPKPDIIPQTPAKPAEENLINTPTGNPEPGNLIPQTPTNPQKTRKPEPSIIQQTPVTAPQPQPTTEPSTVQPPAPPASQKPDSTVNSEQ